jgi:hypothetical protein
VLFLNTFASAHSCSDVGAAPAGRRAAAKHRYIVHVHGSWFDDDHTAGFAFTAGEYIRPAAMRDFITFMKSLVSGCASHCGGPFRNGGVKKRSIVFVGCKGTVTDTHFEELWRQLSLMVADNIIDGMCTRDVPHFVIVPDDTTAAKMQTEAQRIRGEENDGITLHVVQCDGIAGLEPFMRGLINA